MIKEEYKNKVQGLIIGDTLDYSVEFMNYCEIVAKYGEHRIYIYENLQKDCTMESISTVGAELDKQELLGLLIRVSAKR